MTFTHFKNRLSKEKFKPTAYICLDTKCLKRGNRGQLWMSCGEIKFFADDMGADDMGTKFEFDFDVTAENFKHIHCPALGLNRV